MSGNQNSSQKLNGLIGTNENIFKYFVSKMFFVSFKNLHSYLVKDQENLTVKLNCL